MTGAEDAAVLAHGVGGPSNLPVPMSFVLIRATSALTFTFALLAFGWRKPRFDPAKPGRVLPGQNPSGCHSTTRSPNQTKRLGTGMGESTMMPRSADVRSATGPPKRNHDWLSDTDHPARFGGDVHNHRGSAHRRGDRHTGDS